MLSHNAKPLAGVSLELICGSTSNAARSDGTGRFLISAIREETEKPELWFVVVPNRVWKYCRPNSIVEPEIRQQALKSFKQARQAKTFYETRSLFPEMEQEAVPSFTKNNFTINSRLLDAMVLTQIVKESTLANIREPGDAGFDKREAVRQSKIAWNLCTAIFYKVGGRPWKVADIRDGVCYVGLVFKKDETTGTSKNACCAAQMFLDSGDGVVFKGALGPWYNDETGDFHLSYEGRRR